MKREKETSGLEEQGSGYSLFKKRWNLAVEEAEQAGFTEGQAVYLVELRSKIESI